MSFLINGIGYHVLVHALPLQGAQQSSLTSFVLRSVGMIYLVDLDDTPGYKLTIVVPPPPPPKEVMMDEFETKKLMSEQEPPPPPQQQEPFTTKTETAPPAAPSTSTGSPSSNNSSSNNREEEISKAALEIIEDAKRKLDALLRGGTGGSNGGEPTADSSTTNFKGTSRNLLLGVYPTATTTTTTSTATNPTQPSQQPQAEEQPQYVDPNPLMPVALTAMMASGEYDGNNNDEEEAVDA
jgi:hypothetical protein